MSIAALQLERESLDKRLRTEIEQYSVTEQQLRQENIKLHELLNNSLSLNEKLQLSAIESPPSLHNSTATNSFHLSPTSLSHFQTTPPSYYTPTSSQFTSPSAEIVHLRQQLTEARENCLKLERQQTRDMTEMAKVQGSLQGLVKIQEHLSEENKSLGQTFANSEEERETYKQEVKKLHNDLVVSRENLEVVRVEVFRFFAHVVDQLQHLTAQSGRFNDSQLLEYYQLLKDGWESKRLESLTTASIVFELLSSLLLEKTLQLSDLQSETVTLNKKLLCSTDTCNMEEITLLQERVSIACKQLKQMEGDLEKKENELEEKDRQLIALQIEYQQGHKAVGNINSFKKDLETQYQVSIHI